MVKDEYGNKLEGFYLVGLFDSGRKALFSLETSKPFRINENGILSGNCFRRLKRNSFATDWMFIENHKIKDIETDKDLRITLNHIWKEWCKEHKRKYTPIMEM